ncbi:hypothetical protein P8452_20638 [Trifolium repens]|nr:hypothetical protein P8452_20638 [Trifolium repens]
MKAMEGNFVADKFACLDPSSHFHFATEPPSSQPSPMNSHRLIFHIRRSSQNHRTSLHFSAATSFSHSSSSFRRTIHC